MRENNFNKIPKLYHIYYGEVTSLQAYGAFIKIPGCLKQGLVHISQMSHSRVEDPSEMLGKGDRVYCKVIGVEGEGEKIALSMKVVNQSNGRDLDPNNIQSSQDDRKRRQWNSSRGGPRRFDLGAELNTTCRRCGGHGHLAMDCYSSRDNQYDLIPDISESAADDDRSSRRRREKEQKRKHKSKKRQSSSESDSDDSGSEDQRKKSSKVAGRSYSGKSDKYRRQSDSDDSDPRKKPARPVSAGYSGNRGDKYRHQSDSDSSSSKEKLVKKEISRREKHGSGAKEKSGRVKSDSRRRVEQSDSESDQDSKGQVRRKASGLDLDFQNSSSRAWLPDESRDRADGGRGREKMRDSRGDRQQTSRRDSGGYSTGASRPVERSSERYIEAPKKRSRSSSDSDEEEERLREKRSRGTREKSDSGRFVEEPWKKDSSEGGDRKPLSSAGSREGERYRREKY